MRKAIKFSFVEWPVTARPVLPRVLTDDFVRRLEALNAVMRQLRAWKVGVVSQTVYSDCSDFAWYPEIRVDRVFNPRLYPLLSKSEWRGHRRHENVETGNYEYMGVIISWEVKRVD